MLPKAARPEPHPMPAATSMWLQRGRWLTSFSLAGVLLFCVCLLARLDTQTLWQHIAASCKRWIVLSVVAHYATYSVRGWRWQRCLWDEVSHGTWSRWSLLVFFYNAVDNVLPAKLGEVYGAHLARINLGVSRAAALGALVCLRLVDAWVILLLAALASWRLFAVGFPLMVRWGLLGGLLLVAGVTSLILAAALLQRAPPRWLPVGLLSRIHALHRGMWPPRRQWIAIGLLTVILWTLETVSIVTLMWAFSIDVGVIGGLFVTSLPLLASAFPLTPAGVGAVDLTLLSCLRLVGVAPAMAMSVMVVNRLLDYWLHIGAGLVIWAIRHSIGLQTWREVPLAACHDPLPITIGEESRHGDPFRPVAARQFHRR